MTDEPNIPLYVKGYYTRPMGQTKDGLLRMVEVPTEREARHDEIIQASPRCKTCEFFLDPYEEGEIQFRCVNENSLMYLYVTTPNFGCVCHTETKR